MTTKSFIRILRATIFLIGVVFIVIGLFRAEHLEVMNKAVKICLECIGIG